VLDELATDKRFIGLVEEHRPMMKGRFALHFEEERVETPERPGFTFAPLGEAPPYFRQHGLTLFENELRIWDRETGRHQFRLRLPRAGFERIGYNFALGHQVGLGHQNLGHISILNLGAQVAAIDPLGEKVLWHHDVLGLGNAVPDSRAVDYIDEDIKFPPRKPRALVPTPPVEYGKDDSARITYGTAGSLRLGGGVPLTPARLCLPTKRCLVALDPLTGAVCWLRTDVPQDCRLFDDGRHVFVVQFKPDGKVAGTAGYRLDDGAPVRIKDFAALYEKRLSIVDGRLLVWEQEAGNAPVLRLYDAATGKDDWRQEFLVGALPIRCEEPGLTGMVEPNGNVTVWAARTKTPVMSCRLPASDGENRVMAYRLVGDADNFYLASERLRAEDVLSEPRPLFLPWAGLRAIPVNGNLYAFRRNTGQLIWYNELRNQMLLLAGIERLPMLVLASRYWMRIGKAPLRAGHLASEIRAIAKQNGKLWYHGESASTFFHTIRMNQGTGKVELRDRGMKVSMWAVAR
jgi:hypothetical protein